MCMTLHPWTSFLCYKSVIVIRAGYGWETVEKMETRDSTQNGLQVCRIILKYFY